MHGVDGPYRTVFREGKQQGRWSGVSRLHVSIPKLARFRANWHRPIRPATRLGGSNNRRPQGAAACSQTSSTKQDLQEMLHFMDAPPSESVDRLPVDSETINLVRCIAKAADGRKAEEVVALQVHEISSLTSFLVILSGNSRPQNQAIAAAIRKDVEEQFGLKPGGKGVPEGTAESGWMVLDYGAVMVHIMTPKSRLFYNVEGQWRDKGGEYLDLSDILIPNKMEDRSDDAVDGGAFGLNEKDEDDPFWS